MTENNIGYNAPGYKESKRRNCTKPVRVRAPPLPKEERA
jgi:hypothetical protein